MRGPGRANRVTFEGCSDANEAYARLRESVAIEVGAKIHAKDRSAGSGHRRDRRRRPAPLPADARPVGTIVLNKSAPHQFSLTILRSPWCLGAVVWQAGVPGQFVEPDEPTMRLSRTLRRNVGVIAEQVLAADGVIRLMDRRAISPPDKSIDDLAQKTAISVDDLAAVGQRFYGKELVWIEGHTRARGDVRLWGTRLELRDIAGAEKNNSPLWLRRFTSAKNAANGEDLQTAIGAAPDGAGASRSGRSTPARPISILAYRRQQRTRRHRTWATRQSRQQQSAGDLGRRSASRHRQRRAKILPPGLHRQPPTNTDGRIEYEKAKRKLISAAWRRSVQNQPFWMTLTIPAISASGRWSRKPMTSPATTSWWRARPTPASPSNATPVSIPISISRPARQPRPRERPAG